MSELCFTVLDSGILPDGIRATLARIFPGYAGQRLRMTIEVAKEKRSLSQNSYYWTAIVPHVRKVRADLGDPISIQAVHEDLLAEFAPIKQSKKLNGDIRLRPMRSKEMSVNEMSQYVTVITAAMAQFGYPVPLMEEVA